MRDVFYLDSLGRSVSPVLQGGVTLCNADNIYNTTVCRICQALGDGA
jgi:hypothetical protein